MRLFFLLIGLLSCLEVKSQPSDSSIASRLAVTCRIWGLLKYSNPNNCNENINWDNKIIEALPRLLNSCNDTIFNNELTLLISKSDSLSAHKHTKSSFILSSSFVNDAWIESSRFINNDNKKALENIAYSISKFKNCYAQNNFDSFGSITPELSEEDSRKLQDSIISLYSFFKYWNIIYYFYPYPKTIKTQWDSLLIPYIEIFSHIKTRERYIKELLKLTTELRDGHAWVRDEYNNYC